MKVLITGGAGFIGSHVADVCLAAGHEVVIVDNLRTGSVAHVPGGARLHVVDIAAPELDRVLGLERPDVVSHHAAQTSVTVSTRDPVLDARINCTGLLQVLQSCVKHQVGRFVFSSSAGVYGADAPLPTAEEAAPQPRVPYAMHKLLGEYYLQFYGREHGLQATVLRYGNVYGPRQDPDGEAGVVARFIELLLRGERPVIFAYADQPAGMSRDYVYVEDVARANLCALAYPASGTFNIAGGCALRTGELLEAIRVATGAADAGKLAPGVEPARPGELRESWLDITRAATLLGWHPQVSLADGLARTAAYLRTGQTE